MLSSSTDIYLDANATTRVLPQAARDAQDAMEELYGNPSSSHITGLRARHILESARKLTRRVLGAESGRVIFTSGATEAIHLGVFSSLCAARQRGADQAGDRVLLYGATEHKAVPEALQHWNQLLCLNAKVLPIPVDNRGLLDLGFLAEHAPRADLVCTMAVNNETGVITNLPAVERTLRQANPTAPWLVDCVQAVAKMELNLSRTSIDYAAISGHKVHAPKGVGVLYVRDGMPLTPLFSGGGQESGARSGTENLPGVAALAAVFHCLLDERDHTFCDRSSLARHRDQLVASLRRAFPSIVFNTPFECSVATTINFTVQGFASKEILDLFDAAGIRVSSGSACGSANQGSYVLDAMGTPPWRSEGAVRMSFDLTTTPGEISVACRRIEDAGRAMRESCLIVSNEAPVSDQARLDGLIQWKKETSSSWMLIDAKSNECVVVDPREEHLERIASLIRCQRSRVVGVIDTHLHDDDNTPRLHLLEMLGGQAASTALQVDELGWPLELDQHVELADGAEAEFLRIGDRWKVLRVALPGHTADSTALLVAPAKGGQPLSREDVQYAFTGDAIQIGGLGRTDVACGCPRTLHQSLRRLNQVIGPNSVICPSHDYVNGFCTCLRNETACNPLLDAVLNGEMACEQFVSAKAGLDKQLGDPAESTREGWIVHTATPKTLLDVAPEDLRAFFAEHRHALIIDVRETHEFLFDQDWTALGLDQPPENVPLSRLGDFLQQIIHQRDRFADREILFLCRSGNRSGRAAEALRRWGFGNVWHIAGGIALGVRRREGLTVDQDDMEFVI